MQHVAALHSRTNERTTESHPLIVETQRRVEPSARNLKGCAALSTPHTHRQHKHRACMHACLHQKHLCEPIRAHTFPAEWLRDAIVLCIACMRTYYLRSEGCGGAFRNVDARVRRITCIATWLAFKSNRAFYHAPPSHVRARIASVIA